MAKFLSDEFSIVYAFKPADNQAGVDGDSINTAYVSHIMYILQCGTLTGDAVLTVKSGASDGTKTTSETFYYRLAGADQAATGADVYAAPTSATTLTMTAATYDNKILIIEVPIDALTAGQPFVTLNIDAAANAHNSSCVAICKPRYAGQSATSVIA